MRKSLKKTLTILLGLILIIGLMTMISLYYSNELIKDTSEITRPQIIYIILSMLILIITLFIVYILLNKRKKQLKYKASVLNENNKRKKRRLKHREIKTEKAKPKPSNEKIITDNQRFTMLTKIDEEMSKDNLPEFEDDVTLENLCEEFRLFSASKLNLYYDIEDIRRFIAGLSVTRIIILQGMSGTGKTSLAYAFGEYLHNDAVVVPIQPMWKERTDLIGYYNEFTKKFNETTLLQKIYEANYHKTIYITVLDEMNIARIEYYFAEFLSLLELPDYDRRYLDVVSDEWETDPKLLKKGRIILPKNMWFVGTANNDDSTFAISDKVYDRAMVLNLDKKAQPFIANTHKGRRLSETKFTELIEQAQNEYEITQRNLKRIKRFDKYLTEKFQITFGNRIMQQIRNYVPVIVACGGREVDAIDDILSKKVLRKLETKNMVYVKSMTPELLSFIDELFGEDELKLCREYIKQVEINA